MSKENIITKLFEIGAVKFGDFKLKSGVQSPIYFDLRLIVSYPELLKAVGEVMWEKIQDYKMDVLCGVPYTALPIAIAISLSTHVPMVMRRKEVKDYGTKQAIEGVFRSGDHCIVIEDLITSGSSVFETIHPLEKEGLTVKDIVVLIDREQGGRQVIHDRGYRVSAVYTITEILETLERQQRISSETVSKVQNFIQENQVVLA